MFAGFSVAAGNDRFGEHIKLGGEWNDCKVSAHDTEGAMCIFEFTGTGGGPRHLHHEQDEWIYVIEGELDFVVGGERLRLTAGESMTAGVHLGCSILRQRDNLFYHNCDTTGGASGGAIITNIDGKYYIVALHSGWNKVNGLVLNRAVEVSRLDEWLRRNQ